MKGGEVKAVSSFPMFLCLIFPTLPPTLPFFVCVCLLRCFGFLLCSLLISWPSLLPFTKLCVTRFTRSLIRSSSKGCVKFPFCELSKRQINQRWKIVASFMPCFIISSRGLPSFFFCLFLLIRKLKGCKNIQKRRKVIKKYTHKENGHKSPRVRGKGREEA